MEDEDEDEVKKLKKRISELEKLVDKLIKENEAHKQYAIDREIYGYDRSDFY